jgi:diketogulonate reductase-like aldo/keto reductase
MKFKTWNRRDVLNATVALGLAPRLSVSESENMLTRPIPGTDESIPVVGLGTWEVFDVAGSREEIAARKEIIDLLAARGGSVIDSSPMYRRSERIVGEIIEASGNRNDLFLATKVWTNGKSRGESQMQRSIELMNAGVIDLMQVHNLRDVDVHMATIREWMREYGPQFIQINYSLGEREAEQRVLPLAQELGVAVLINRPFVEGRLFSAVRGQALPEWANEFAESWGQFFLKFIVSHPAVTCVIPGTSKPHHMADNLGAGFGTLPDASMRQRMVAFWDSI